MSKRSFIVLFLCAYFRIWILSSLLNILNGIYNKLNSFVGKGGYSSGIMILNMGWISPKLVIRNWNCKFQSPNKPQNYLIENLCGILKISIWEENGCGPIAGNHWLNYVTPSLLDLRRYPIGPMIARTPNSLGGNSCHHTTWENPKRKHTRQTHLNIEIVQMDKFSDQDQSWSRPEIILPFKQGRPVWQPKGIMVVTVDLRETRMDPQGPMCYLLLQRE